MYWVTIGYAWRAEGAAGGVYVCMYVCERAREGERRLLRSNLVGNGGGGSGERERETGGEQCRRKKEEEERKAGM